MSTTAGAEGGRRATTERRRRCCRSLWTVLPHVSLIASLVVYGCFGALVFSHVENQGTFNITDGEYGEFLLHLVDVVRVRTGEATHSPARQLLALSPALWNFFSSLFFCCTVFTTVGYGEMFPVTLPGKLFCIVYAMVGIPLMLLVITDVGDILAILLSKAYIRLHKLYKTSVSCWSFRRDRGKQVEEAMVHDRTYTFKKDVLIRKPMDISQVLHQQASIRSKSNQLQNATIFNHIIARENLGQGLLQPSRSCPELHQMPLNKDTSLWNYPEIGEELDKLDVPMTVILLVVFAYILLMGLILPLWEDSITHFDAFYFCFITLTTIGFGDIVPQHPKFFMLTSLFIISGMAIMSMAFKLSQSRIVSGYRKCISDSCMFCNALCKYRNDQG
uniref:Potassium channel domain-containing protein n=1 Tax=Scleropages formosus TaxID=113540 RepID=A0A8C9V795_SCLFO